MASQTLKEKAAADAVRSALESRRLTEEIDGQAVYVRRITNSDLRRKDEMDDEVAELRIEHEALVGRDDVKFDDDGDVLSVDHTPGEIDELDDPDRRRELRGRARELANQMRQIDARMLGIYVETESGEPFPDEAFDETPVQTLTSLTRQATEWTYGKGDDKARPTDGRSASG